jgi:tetratricopeptide (TPR) repeat protein
MGEQLIFNGINGATGSYLLPPMSPEEVSAIAKGDARDKEHLYDLQLRNRQSGKTKRGVKAGVDPLRLSSAGWGIIFASADSDKIPEIKEALGGLLDLRRSQAGELYKEFSDEGGYQHEENYLDFLGRHNIGPGPADPVRVPYYLLIVGDPETIPFEFQYQLDVQYAVGRIYFDAIEQYAQYAQSVVEMETAQKSSPREATFFGVQNEDDPATQLSATQLIQPLAEKFSGEGGMQPWEIQSVVGDRATKSALADILGGERAPSLFFSASHGMGFPKDDPRQIPHQGALLCQDWPGPHNWKEPIPENYYFSAEDISAEAELSGSIAFLFACYGAGTPQMDDFAHQAFRDPVAIAPHAFLAQLPQKLLSHPKGGMQAVIGHVERAWGYSFVWEQTGSQLAVFESALKTIMEGSPVGYALEFFNERYAELSTVLSTELQGVQFGKIVDDVDLAGKWTANNDARSYVIIGDPAVRLRVGESEQDEDQAIKLTTAGGIEGGIQTSSALPPQAAEIELFVGANEAERLIELGMKALDEFPDGGTPLQKAELIFAIGTSFAQLQLGKRVENLKAAIAQFHTALELLSPDEQRDEWQRIQISLANSYQELYAWTGESRYADRAESAYSKGLEITSRDEHPDEWASANLNLAHLYELKREFESEGDWGEKALKYYRQVLEVIDRQSESFFWAHSHLNLANLQIEVLTSNEDDNLRSEAIENVQAALEVFTTERFPYQFVEAKLRLGDLYLGQYTGDRVKSIELAIRAYEATIDVRSKVAGVIPEWSIFTRLGDVYSQRVQGDRNNNLFQALAYYKQSRAELVAEQDQEALAELDQKIAKIQSS